MFSSKVRRYGATHSRQIRTRRSDKDTRQWALQDQSTKQGFIMADRSIILIYSNYCLAAPWFNIDEETIGQHHALTISEIINVWRHRITRNAQQFVFCQFQNGDTALHIATAMRKRKIARVLIEAGINCRIKNKVSWTKNMLKRSTVSELTFFNLLFYFKILLHCIWFLIWLKFNFFIFLFLISFDFLNFWFDLIVESSWKKLRSVGLQYSLVENLFYAFSADKFWALLIRIHLLVLSHGTIYRNITCHFSWSLSLRGNYRPADNKTNYTNAALKGRDYLSLYDFTARYNGLY